MVAIKLFCSVRKYFEGLGFHAPPELNQNCEINHVNGYYIFAVAGMFFPITAYLLFRATSAYEFSVSFYLSVVMVTMTVYCVVLIYRMGSIVVLIEKYEEFIGKRMEYKPISAVKYVELNEKIELTSKWTYIFLTKMVFVGIAAPLAIFSVVGYYIYDLGDDSFILPWPMLLPFNWKTPIGYLIAVSAESASAHSALFCFTPIMSFFVGSAWLIICSLEDISSDLTELKASETLNKSPMEIKKRFCHIIRFYSDARQFIGEFNANYEFIIIALFLFSLLSLTCSLMVILSQLSEQNSQPVEMIFTLILLVTSFSANFFFCEFGELVGNQINIFDAELWQCDWYAFPIEVQKLLLTLMSSTQRSTAFRGYGNIECTRDSFKKTVNGGFSYFMTLQRVAA